MSSSVSKADTFLWLAYAEFVKKQLQVAEVGPNDVIWPYPVTQRGPAAGSAIPKAVTNFLVYNLADSLRPADSPGNGTAGSYIKQLRQYLAWVEPAPPASPEALERLEKARKSLHLAKEKREAELTNARVRYEVATKMDPELPKFFDWVIHNAQGLTQATQEVKDAAQESTVARAECYGPDASQLNEYLDAVGLAARGYEAHAGLNMPALTADQDLRSKFENAAVSGASVSQDDLKEVEKMSTYTPSYQINTLFSTMNDWVHQGSGPRAQWLTLDLNVGQSNSWNDYGLTEKEVSHPSPAPWFTFFSAIVERNGEKKTEYLNIEDEQIKNEQTNVEIKVSFQQIAALDIQKGLWDVPNVKAMYPTLRKGAPPILTSEMVLVNKVLLAYDVALHVTFKGSLKQKARDLLEDAKKAGEGLCILGFHVGRRSDQYVKTRFDDIKWDEATGSIELAPAPDVAYPTLLGFQGRRL